MNSEESDEVLVSRYKEHKDDDSFKELMRRYHKKVYCLVASSLGVSFVSEVEDVVQEIFVRVYRGIGSFRVEASFSTWLYRIAVNHSYSFKARRRNTYSCADWNLIEIASGGSGPADAINTSQLREVLDSAIDRLPAEYQVAVRLHYWFGVPVREIASLTTTRENTVKSYLHRARKLLAIHLSHRREEL